VAEQPDALIEQRVERGVRQFAHVLAAGVERKPPRSRPVERRLEGDVWHRPNQVDSRPEVLERLHDGGARLRVADVQGGHGEHEVVLQLRRHKRLRWCGDQHARHRQLVRSRVRAVTPSSQRLGCRLDREHHQPRQHDRAEPVQTELELGHDPEVPAPTPDPPRTDPDAPPRLRARRRRRRARPRPRSGCRRPTRTSTSSSHTRRRG